MSVLATFCKPVCVIIICLTGGGLHPFLQWGTDTNSGLLTMLMGTGSACDNVQQEMSLMVQRHEIVVEFSSRFFFTQGLVIVVF